MGTGYRDGTVICCYRIGHVFHFPQGRESQEKGTDDAVKLDGLTVLFFRFRFDSPDAGDFGEGGHYLPANKSFL